MTYSCFSRALIGLPMISRYCSIFASRHLRAVLWYDMLQIMMMRMKKSRRYRKKPTSWRYEHGMIWNPAGNSVALSRAIDSSVRVIFPPSLPLPYIFIYLRACICSNQPERRVLQAPAYYWPGGWHQTENPTLLWHCHSHSIQLDRLFLRLLCTTGRSCICTCHRLQPILPPGSARRRRRRRTACHGCHNKPIALHLGGHIRIIRHTWKSRVSIHWQGCSSPTRIGPLWSPIWFRWQQRGQRPLQSARPGQCIMERIRIHILPSIIIESILLYNTWI